MKLISGKVLCRYVTFREQYVFKFKTDPINNSATSLYNKCGSNHEHPQKWSIFKCKFDQNSILIVIYHMLDDVIIIHYVILILL